MPLGSKIIIIISCILVFNELECSLIRRFNYDARLYEHFALDSRFIQYSRTEPDDWANITALTEAKNFSFSSMICTLGPGAWLFYPDPDYEMGNSQLYYLVIGEHCVRSDDIESIQPLGAMNELLEQGLMLFEKPQFAARHKLVTGAEGSQGSRDIEGGSLIFTGGGTFLIEGGDQKICLQPGLTVFDDGYCLIPNLKSSFGIEGSITVTENCTYAEGENETMDSRKLIVQNCYTSGVHEIYSDQDLTIDKLNEVCSGGGDNFLKNKFTILMDMWEKRIESGEDTALKRQPEPIKPENQNKLNILWNVLMIFKSSCEEVEETYVNLLGHLFAMHLKHVWNTEGYNGTSTTEETWKITQQVFEYCTENVDDLPKFSGLACKQGDDDLNKRVLDTEELSGLSEEETWFEIVNGDLFDPVIEQIWLIINFVLPTCNVASGYINNDWSDLVLVFHENYLDPLQDIWAAPNDWNKIYNAVFHGYDMRRVHKSITNCLRGALEHSPLYDPIGRPKKFRDLMTYQYQTPKYGKIEPNATRSKRG